MSQKEFHVKLKKELTIPAGSTIKVLPSVDSDRAYLEVISGKESLAMMMMWEVVKKEGEDETSPKTEVSV